MKNKLLTLPGNFTYDELVTFESANAHELKKVSEEAVNDYIVLCHEKGIQPEKPFKGNFNVRVKPSLHKRAYMKALQDGISLNKFFEQALEKELGM